MIYLLPQKKYTYIDARALTYFKAKKRISRANASEMLEDVPIVWKEEAGAESVCPSEG